MNEEHIYKGSKTKNYFSAYLLASVQGRRKRYLEIQKKIQLAENNSDEQEYTEADLSMEEHLERKKREELLLNETQGIYPESAGWETGMMMQRKMIRMIRMQETSAILDSGIFRFIMMIGETTLQ